VADPKLTCATTTDSCALLQCRHVGIVQHLNGAVHGVMSLPSFIKQTCSPGIRKEQLFPSQISLSVCQCPEVTSHSGKIFFNSFGLRICIPV